MRFTVRRKIIVGVAVIVCLGAIALVSVYRGLTNLHTNLRELDQREGPAVRAAYEMEINLLEITADVLGYLESRDPAALAQLATDRKEFEEFHAEYLRRSVSPQAAALGARVKEWFLQFLELADKMIANRNAESARFAQVMHYIEQIDETLDDQLESRIDRAQVGALEKLVDSIDLEADVGEVGIWLANYRQTRQEGDRARIWSNAEEFREQAARLRRNPYLTAAERRTVTVVDAMFREMIQALEDVLAYDSEIVEYNQRFETLRKQLDDVLDDEIQALALVDLSQPISEADAAVTAVATRAGVLLPLFLLSACAVAGLLIVNVTRSVSRLMAGTEAVRHGDLSARIQVKGRDELADLAGRFNQMVAQLEATTVSKAALEASDARLRATNEELREEIAERERAEAAERQLRRELQRTEMLARMGSLVAGVAHEARNPLFGISSTVDAIEARLVRLGSHQTYADHLAVLRREITRLNTLTRDLLEYGKPSGVEIGPTHIEDVLERAMQACRALAEQTGVEMSCRVDASVNTVMMDSDRMIQVFQNLLENAIHHAPRGTPVIVDVRPVHEENRAWVRCEVVDQGPGINVDDLTRIFEPFFSRRARGTGLGLSIVDRIVDLHGGRTAARNGAAGGAVLTVDLPVDGDTTPAQRGGERAIQDSDRRR
jgi:signal transduction histidine kinase/CHASE3 domain sensor protein